MVPSAHVYKRLLLPLQTPLLLACWPCCTRQPGSSQAQLFKPKLASSLGPQLTHNEQFCLRVVGAVLGLLEPDLCAGLYLSNAVGL